MDKLRRILGFPLLTFYGVGMILGAGIYSVIGKAAGIAHESLWLSFLLAALAAALTALSYAELGTAFPKAGAEYIYLKNAFPRRRWAGVIAGLLIAFAGAATASTVALAFAGYLREFAAVPAVTAAALLLLFFTAVNIFGLKQSSWLNVLFTLVEIAGLVMFIFFGARAPEFGRAFSATPSAATLGGAALIIFAYFGFENIVSLAEEAKDPARDIPRAVFTGLGLCTLLYVLVSLAALALLEPAELAASEAAVTEATRRVSPSAARVLGGVALFSTANTALIALVTTSRVLFGMADDGALPGPLGRVLGRRRTPWVTALVTLIVALLLLPIGQVETVAAVSALATMLCFIAVNVAVIHLRRTRPELKRPFRVPWNVASVPVPAVLAILICLVFLTQFSALVYYVGGGAVLVCALAAFFLHQWH